MSEVFEIIGVVKESEIPEGRNQKRGLFEPVAEKMDTLPAGSVLHVKVTKPHHVKSIKNMLEKKRSTSTFNVMARGWSGKPPYSVYVKKVK